MLVQFCPMLQKAGAVFLGKIFDPVSKKAHEVVTGPPHTRLFRLKIPINPVFQSINCPFNRIAPAVGEPDQIVVELPRERHVNKISHVWYPYDDFWLEMDYDMIRE